MAVYQIKFLHNEGQDLKSQIVCKFRKISRFLLHFCANCNRLKNIVFKLSGATKQKSRIRETSNLSTDADRRTDTILERLRDLSLKKIKKIYIINLKRLRDLSLKTKN